VSNKISEDMYVVFSLRPAVMHTTYLYTHWANRTVVLRYSLRMAERWRLTMTLRSSPL
jgi:hypothetical protein